MAGPGADTSSENLGSPENRTTFVKACVDLVSQYGLEGLDIEYVLRRDVS